MSQPPFPTGARIGHRHVAIVTMSKKEADERGEFGRWEPAEQRILVQEGMCVGETASTLLHELTHAVVGDYGIRSGISPQEEYVATVIGSGLTVLMQENVEVRDWFAWAWAQVP